MSSPSFFCWVVEVALLVCCRRWGVQQWLVAVERWLREVVNSGGGWSLWMVVENEKVVC
jgi:hypothetical protein